MNAKKQVSSPGEYGTREAGEIHEILRRTPILAYHKIENRREVGINVVSPEKFRRHLSLIRQMGFQAITFREVLSASPLPPKPLILTFDDAYESIYHNAYPLLREFGMKGVIFVIAGFIGRWNDWDANLGGIRFRHLNEGQLRELEAAGWEIGAHSVTHRALTRLKNPALRREIEESRRILEPLCSGPLTTFAYPFGLHSARVREAVGEAGFAFGCKGIRGAGGKDDLLALQRIPVYQFEGNRALAHKLRWPALPRVELLKLSLLGWPAALTPFYQRLFKAELFLEN